MGTTPPRSRTNHDRVPTAFTLGVRPTISAGASWCGSRAASVASATFVAMTAHAAEPVPDADPDEAAVAAAALREYREWVAKGRPGAVSHEEAMAELLGDPL